MDKVAPKSRSKSAMLAANKCSHDSAAKDEGRSSKYWHHKSIIAPRIRVVYLREPEIIKTDPQNFRSLVQRLTGKSTHKSKEKKKRTNPKILLSEVISTDHGRENLEDTFYSNDKLPIMEKKAITLSEDCSVFVKGFNDAEMIFPALVNEGLMHEIPLVRNNSPFCNMYDQAGLYRWT
jgi:hypothetical protein